MRMNLRFGRRGREEGGVVARDVYDLAGYQHRLHRLHRVVVGGCYSLPPIYFALSRSHTRALVPRKTLPLARVGGGEARLPPSSSLSLALLHYIHRASRSFLPPVGENWLQMRESCSREPDQMAGTRTSLAAIFLWTSRAADTLGESPRTGRQKRRSCCSLAGYWFCRARGDCAWREREDGAAAGRPSARACADLCSPRALSLSLFSAYLYIHGSHTDTREHCCYLLSLPQENLLPSVAPFDPALSLALSLNYTDAYNLYINTSARHSRCLWVLIVIGFLYIYVLVLSSLGGYERKKRRETKVALALWVAADGAPRSLRGSLTNCCAESSRGLGYARTRASSRRRREQPPPKSGEKGRAARACSPQWARVVLAPTTRVRASVLYIGIHREGVATRVCVRSCARKLRIFFL